MPSLVVPQEYGYVLSSIGVAALYLFSLGIQTGRARRAAGVPYPYAYAEKAEAEKDPKKNIFNCAQRVHQNTLEIFPIFSTLLLIGGLRHPVAAASAGGIWTVCRIIFSRGYMTGVPANRTVGAIGSFLALFGLLGTSVSTIYNLLS